MSAGVKPIPEGYHGVTPYLAAWRSPTRTTTWPNTPTHGGAAPAPENVRSCRPGSGARMGADALTPWRIGLAAPNWQPWARLIRTVALIWRMILDACAGFLSSAAVGNPRRRSNKEG